MCMARMLMFARDLYINWMLKNEYKRIEFSTWNTSDWFQYTTPLDTSKTPRTIFEQKMYTKIQMLVVNEWFEILSLHEVRYKCERLTHLLKFRVCDYQSSRFRCLFVLSLVVANRRKWILCFGQMRERDVRVCDKGEDTLASARIKIHLNEIIKMGCCFHCCCLLSLLIFI